MFSFEPTEESLKDSTNIDEKAYMGKLDESGLFKLKKRFKIEKHESIQLCKGCCRDKRKNLFSMFKLGGTGNNWFQLQQGRFRLLIQIFLWWSKFKKHWNRLSGESGKFLCQRYLKTAWTNIYLRWYWPCWLPFLAGRMD